MESHDWAVVPTSTSEYIKKVLAQYRLAEVEQILENGVAKVNRVYLVLLGDGKKYVLRKSYIPVDGPLNRANHTNHLLFEAELLQFLESRNFSLTPHIILNQLSLPISLHGGEQFMLFSFLPGSREGSWNNLSRMKNERWVGVFGSLGSFAKAVQAFRPRHVVKEKTLLDFTKESLNTIEKLEWKLQGESRELFSENLPQLKSFVKETLDIFELIHYNTLPRQVVHFDYHIGNINFSNNEVVGIMDFDWCRIDYRFADIASGIGLACPYEGRHCGVLDTNFIALAIKSYYQSYGKSEYNEDVEPLLLEAALRAYLLFQCLYTFQCCAQGTEKNLHSARFAFNTLFQNDFRSLVKNAYAIYNSSFHSFSTS
jgi:Ser/Thr protein kinase RdoA (MazF antagonist)